MVRIVSQGKSKGPKAMTPSPHGDSCIAFFCLTQIANSKFPDFRQIRGLSRVLAREAEEDAKEGYHSQSDGIVEVGDDVERGDGGKAGGHEELCAVGDESLCEAAEGVEQGGAHAAVYAVAVGNVACHGAHGDEGYGIVGGAEVGKDDEQGDGELGTAPAADAAGEHADEPVDAAVVTDEGEHAAGKEGDDDELAHAHDAFAHGAHPTHEVEAATGHAYDAGQHDADEEHDEHVHACHGEHEHGEVGQHLVPCGPGYIGGGYHALPQDDVYGEHDEGGGGSEVDVGLELVAHAHALCLRGHDGGVGDEGEVVAEEGAAHDDGHDEGERRAGLPGYAHGHGGEGYDGAYGGAYGEGDEAGGQEEAGQEHAVGQEAQGEVDGGVDGSHGTGRLGKSSGEDEDPYHEHEVLVARTAGEDGDALLETELGGDTHGIGRGGEEGDGQGHLVEVTGKDGAYEVDYHEDEHGGEGEHTSG